MANVDVVGVFALVELGQIEGIWLGKLGRGRHEAKLTPSCGASLAKRLGPSGGFPRVANRAMRSAVSVAPLVDHDLVCRRVLVRDKDVVFVKGILEASEGLGALFAERGGELIISAPLSRERELDEVLADLQNELQASVSHLPLPAVR